MRTIVKRNRRKAAAIVATAPEAENIAPVENVAADTVAPEATGEQPEAANIEQPEAENVSDVTAITEAQPDPRVAREARIAADRASVKSFYRALNGTVSIPVKPLSAFKLAAVSAHPIARNPSARQAAAIAAAFIAANVELADGAEAPRVFEIDGVRSAIENGALRDAISAGLISVSGDSPETSTITLAAKAAKIITGLLGEKAIKAAYGA